MSMTRELAELYAEGARGCFERDGQVDPLLALHYEGGPLVLSVTPDGDVPEAFGKVTVITAALLKPDIIVTVSEGWGQKVEGNEAAVEKAMKEGLRRGELAERAEAGDASVATTIMTIAWTLNRSGHTIIDWPQSGGVYERDEYAERMPGNLADQVLGAWRYAIEPREQPPDISLEMVVGLLGAMGLISGAMFPGGPDDD